MKMTKEYLANELNKFDNTQDGTLLLRLVREVRHFLCETGNAGKNSILGVYVSLLSAMLYMPDGWLLVNYAPLMLNNLLVAWDAVVALDQKATMLWHVLDEGCRKTACAQLEHNLDDALKHFEVCVKTAIIGWFGRERQLKKDTALPWWKVTVTRTEFGSVMVQAASELEAVDIVYGEKPAYNGACWKDTFTSDNPDGTWEYDDSYGDDSVVQVPYPHEKGSCSVIGTMEPVGEDDEQDIVRVELRDYNGHRHAVECFANRVCDVFSNTDIFNDDDEEILLVYHRGICIYSGLGNDDPLLFEDLIGFFA